MKILQVSFSELNGGAAISARRLHKSLLLNGACSSMLVRDRSTDDPTVITVPTHDDVESRVQMARKAAVGQFWVPLSRREPISNTLFGVPYPGVDLTNLPLVHDARVINLHWIDFFQSPQTVSRLRRLNRPIVWTLHDQMPMTGGCHYTAFCEGYTETCAFCPQLEGGGYGITEAVLRERTAAMKGLNLTVASPSKWLADCARRSTVFRDVPVHVIPYSLDLDIFHPGRREAGRRALDAQPDEVCILFGAHDLKEDRKGFSLLLNAVRIALEDAAFADLYGRGKVRFLTFGHRNEGLDAIGIRYTSLGFIQSERDMGQVVAAADIYVVPSIEENYANTIIEALAAGVPTIGYDTGGVPDLLGQEGLGVLVSPLTAGALSEAIRDLVADAPRRAAIGARARSYMEETHAYPIQGQRYLELYSDLLQVSPSAFSRAPTVRSIAHIPSQPEDYAVGAAFWQGAVDPGERIWGVPPQTLFSDRAYDLEKAAAPAVPRLVAMGHPLPFCEKSRPGNPSLDAAPHEGEPEAWLGRRPLQALIEIKQPRNALILSLHFPEVMADEHRVEIVCNGRSLAVLPIDAAGAARTMVPIPGDLLERVGSGRVRVRIELRCARTFTSYGLLGPRVCRVAGTLLDLPAREAAAPSPGAAPPGVAGADRRVDTLTVFGENWYGFERLSARDAGRWLGPERSSTVDLLGPVDRDSVIVIEIALALDPTWRVPADVLLDGTPLRLAARFDAGERMFTAYRPAATQERTTAGTLTLTSRGVASPASPGHDDPRILGFFLSGVGVYSLRPDEDFYLDASGLRTCPTDGAEAGDRDLPGELPRDRTGTRWQAGSLKISGDPVPPSMGRLELVAAGLRLDDVVFARLACTLMSRDGGLEVELRSELAPEGRSALGSDSIFASGLPLSVGFAGDELSEVSATPVHQIATADVDTLKALLRALPALMFEADNSGTVPNRLLTSWMARALNLGKAGATSSTMERKAAVPLTWTAVHGFDRWQHPIPALGLTEAYRWSLGRACDLGVHLPGRMEGEIEITYRTVTPGQTIELRQGGEVIGRSAPARGEITVDEQMSAPGVFGPGLVQLDLVLDHTTTDPGGRDLGLIIGSVVLREPRHAA